MNERWHFKVRVLLSLALAWQAACFGLGDHSQAVSRALQRAESLWDDSTKLDKVHLSEGKDPLEAASDVRPVFRQYMLALRHLMAFAAPQSAFQGPAAQPFWTLAGVLDVELSQLTSLGKVEPLYFWHGPKRHLPAKFRELVSLQVGGKPVLEHLSSGLSLEPPGPLNVKPMPELGLAYPHTARPVGKLSAALRVTSPADVCAAGKAAAGARVQLIISGVAAKANLPSCLGGQLNVMWDMAAVFADLFDGSSQMPLQDALEGSLRSTKRTYIDVLGLPPKAWSDKRLKQYVSQSVNAFLKGGKVKAVALVGPLASKQLQKILAGAFKPTEWLTLHDDCAPMSPTVLEIADKMGVKVIGSGVPCGSVLEFVAEQEKLDTTALLGRWTAELGLTVAFPSSTSDLAATLRRIQEAQPLSSQSWRLLSATAALSRPAALAVAQDFEDNFGLRDAISHAADLAKDLQSGNIPTPPGTVSEKVWQNLEQDRAQFDDNFYIIYKDDFLTPEKYNLVKSEAAYLWKSQELDPNCNLDGRDRTGGYVLDASLRNSSLYQIFYGDDEFRLWVSRMIGHQMFPSDFPLELREYPSGSSGMNCHRDLLMYINATLDLEFVYTVDNHGSCVTTFENRRGEKTEVHTKGNSLIMVRPNSAMHCVTPTEGGHRTILKFIYVGDYRKSSEFSMYTTNNCQEDNANVKVVLGRRHAEL